MPGSTSASGEPWARAQASSRGISWIAAGSDGILYVTDSDNNRLQRFTAGGAYLGEWGELGAGSGQFNFPTSPSVDDNGFVYVPDSGNRRVQVFKTDGTFVGAWGEAGAAPGQFNQPTAIAIGPDGSVLVDDKDNSRIQRFGSVATATASTSWGSLKAHYR